MGYLKFRSGSSGEVMHDKVLRRSVEVTTKSRRSSIGIYRKQANQGRHSQC